MKAMVYTQYGPPSVLKLQEVEKPSPKEDEVLVQVYGASINHSDWSFLRGKPFLVRLMGAGGLLKPKVILGADIAGRVAGVGKKVTRFQPGDEVFGDISDSGWGGFAEYICSSEDALAPKPVNITFEEAAAVPQAGVVALQGLRDKGNLQPDQKVLINGASGGIGTFAVQIAKSFGAEVTGLCSAKNSDMVRSIGADHVIDYTKEDFTKNKKQYDLILAAKGYRSIFDYKRALSDRGRYVMTGGSGKQIFEAMLLSAFLSKTGGKKLAYLSAQTSQKDLVFLKNLVEEGKIVPVIDKCYPLGEIAEALRYYGEGHSRGKVVITMGH